MKTLNEHQLNKLSPLTKCVYGILDAQKELFKEGYCLGQTEESFTKKLETMQTIINQELN